jgi:tRNA (cytosine34-C5)-methyltransferase
MVYSTCSLNPVENEAVVYNLLLKYKDRLELIDVRDKLPGLKTVKGLLTWNLMDKNGEIYEKVEQVGSEYVNLMRPYMFPPELTVAKELNLDRCIRVLPHHQNTGGFFIAVIRKKPLIDEAANLIKNEQNLAQAPEKQSDMKAPPAKRQKHMFEENPFKFIDTNNQLLTDWSKIKEFFQISDDFPLNQMMTRNRKDENVKNVYFVSRQIRELTINNLDRFKFINMGVPIFSKAEIKDASNIDLRICQESLDIILKYFKKRIVYITTFDDLIKILTQSMPSLNELSEDLQNQIKEQCDGQSGSLIFTTKSNDPKDELFKFIKRNQNDVAISFTAWLGKTSLRPLINVNARSFFMSICGIDQKTIGI